MKKIIYNKVAKGLSSLIIVIVLMSSILATSIFYNNNITANVAKEDLANYHPSSMKEANNLDELRQLNEGWYQIIDGYVFYLETFDSAVLLDIKIKNPSNLNGYLVVNSYGNLNFNENQWQLASANRVEEKTVEFSNAITGKAVGMEKVSGMEPAPPPSTAYDKNIGTSLKTSKTSDYTKGQSNIFLFRDGTTAKNLYYQYVAGVGWQVSDSGFGWSTAARFIAQSSGLTVVNSNFIKSLETKDFASGYTALLSRTAANKEGGLAWPFNNADLLVYDKDNQLIKIIDYKTAATGVSNGNYILIGAGTLSDPRPVAPTTSPAQPTAAAGTAPAQTATSSSATVGTGGAGATAPAASSLSPYLVTLYRNDQPIKTITVYASSDADAATKSTAEANRIGLDVKFYATDTISDQKIKSVQKQGTKTTVTLQNGFNVQLDDSQAIDLQKSASMAAQPVTQPLIISIPQGSSLPSAQPYSLEVGGKIFNLEEKPNKDTKGVDYYYKGTDKVADIYSGTLYLSGTGDKKVEPSGSYPSVSAQPAQSATGIAPTTPQKKTIKTEGFTLDTNNNWYYTFADGTVKIWDTKKQVWADLPNVKYVVTVAGNAPKIDIVYPPDATSKTATTVVATPVSSSGSAQGQQAALQPIPPVPSRTSAQQQTPAQPAPQTTPSIGPAPAKTTTYVSGTSGVTSGVMQFQDNTFWDNYYLRYNAQTKQWEYSHSQSAWYPATQVKGGWSEPWMSKETYNMIHNLQGVDDYSDGVRTILSNVKSGQGLVITSNSKSTELNSAQASAALSNNAVFSSVLEQTQGSLVAKTTSPSPVVPSTVIPATPSGATQQAQPAAVASPTSTSITVSNKQYTATKDGTWVVATIGIDKYILKDDNTLWRWSTYKNDYVPETSETIKGELISAKSKLSSPASAAPVQAPAATTSTGTPATPSGATSPATPAPAASAAGGAGAAAPSATTPLSAQSGQVQQVATQDVGQSGIKSGTSAVFEIKDGWGVNQFVQYNGETGKWEFIVGWGSGNEMPVPVDQFKSNILINDKTEAIIKGLVGKDFDDGVGLMLAKTTSGKEIAIYRNNQIESVISEGTVVNINSDRASLAISPSQSGKNELNNLLRQSQGSLSTQPITRVNFRNQQLTVARENTWATTQVRKPDGTVDKYALDDSGNLRYYNPQTGKWDAAKFDTSYNLELYNTLRYADAKIDGKAAQTTFRGDKINAIQEDTWTTTVIETKNDNGDIIKTEKYAIDKDKNLLLYENNGWKKITEKTAFTNELIASLSEAQGNIQKQVATIQARQAQAAAPAGAPAQTPAAAGTGGAATPAPGGAAKPAVAGTSTSADLTPPLTDAKKQEAIKWNNEHPTQVQDFKKLLTDPNGLFTLSEQEVGDILKDPNQIKDYQWILGINQDGKIGDITVTAAKQQWSATVKGEVVSFDDIDNVKEYATQTVFVQENKDGSKTVHFEDGQSTTIKKGQSINLLTGSIETLTAAPTAASTTFAYGVGTEFKDIANKGKNLRITSINNDGTITAKEIKEDGNLGDSFTYSQTRLTPIQSIEFTKEVKGEAPSLQAQQPLRIKIVGDKWAVVNDKGETIGLYDTAAEAIAQLPPAQQTPATTLSGSQIGIGDIINGKEVTDVETVNGIRYIKFKDGTQIGMTANQEIDPKTGTIKITKAEPVPIPGLEPEAIQSAILQQLGGTETLKIGGEEYVISYTFDSKGNKVPAAINGKPVDITSSVWNSIRTSVRTGDVLEVKDKKITVTSTVETTQGKEDEPDYRITTTQQEKTFGSKGLESTTTTIGTIDSNDNTLYLRVINDNRITTSDKVFDKNADGTVNEDNYIEYVTDSRTGALTEAKIVKDGVVDTTASKEKTDTLKTEAKWRARITRLQSTFTEFKGLQYIPSLFVSEQFLLDWRNTVDKAFSIGLGTQYWTSKICDSKLKLQNEGVAYAETPQGLAQIGAHIEATRTKPIVDETGATTYIYKITFQVRNGDYEKDLRAPENMSINVFITGAGEPISSSLSERNSVQIFKKNINIGRGSTFGRFGTQSTENSQPAIVQESKSLYQQICIKFDKVPLKWKIDNNILCNKIKESDAKPLELAAPQQQGTNADLNDF